jgi:hypothetical protein
VKPHVRETDTVVAVANDLAEHSDAACADAELHANAADFGAFPR